jgi:hypothetical protein
MHYPRVFAFEVMNFLLAACQGQKEALLLYA